MHYNSFVIIDIIERLQLWAPTVGTEDLILYYRFQKYSDINHLSYEIVPISLVYIILEYKMYKEMSLHSYNKIKVRNK